MESKSAETRKQTIAKLQEEIKKLNELELKEAEIRLDAAQKTLYIARQEYNAAEKIRNNLLESVQKGITIGGDDPNLIHPPGPEGFLLVTVTRYQLIRITFRLNLEGNVQTVNVHTNNGALALPIKRGAKHPFNPYFNLFVSLVEKQNNILIRGRGYGARKGPKK
jgi:hypothetical protein